MGDDTWMSVFPDSFESNMTFPYDSFNVEDLHTVDEGVILNLFPLLEDPSKPSDFIIGHFLGVDHVGHRVGPDHPSMIAKLRQMNNVLSRVVKLLDDDTLLVVLGDHGMDKFGDHGGDGEHETSSALWIYSKSRPIVNPSIEIPSGLLQYKTFPGETRPHRSIQQIDLLPSLSLLLGLPIPFNNLGAIIPELFARETSLETLRKALYLNALQIKNYLDAYRGSASGGDLDGAWKGLQSAWTATLGSNLSTDALLITYSNYARSALLACRAMWAQFNPFLMSLGLVLFTSALFTSWIMYSNLSRRLVTSDQWLSECFPFILRGAAAGSVIGFITSFATKILVPGMDALDWIMFTAPFGSALVLFALSPPKLSIPKIKFAYFVLILHAISFLSNSFTFWEDRTVPFLLVSSIVPYFLDGFAAPLARYRDRILSFSALFAIAIRLMSISTVCREEQGSYCHVTFYSSSTVSSPFYLALISIVPLTFALPYGLSRVLHITRSDVGLGSVFPTMIFAPSLLSGTVYWLLEYAESTASFGEPAAPYLRFLRTWVARFGFAYPIAVGGSLWYRTTFCIEMQTDSAAAQLNPGGKRQLTVLGFSNAFGAPYILFFTIFFSLIYSSTQLTGQLTLGLGFAALVSYLELLDTVRDARAMNLSLTSNKLSEILDSSSSSGSSQPPASPPLEFSDIVPIALLGLQMFYSTGHQSVISSIQWKTAFILTPTVVYPFSPATVVFNTLGGFLLAGLAVPLVALWNRAPLYIGNTPKPKSGSNSKNESDPFSKLPPPPLLPDSQIQIESVLAAVGLMIYYTALLLGAAVSAAVLRRHLMVWKVFAPRFMAGALELITIDVGILLGTALGVSRIGKRINATFGPRS